MTKINDSLRRPSLTKGELAQQRLTFADKVFRAHPPPPDWRAWKNVQSAHLWELVALSCNIDPNTILGWKKSVSAYRAPKGFLDRLRLAESMLSINRGELRSVRDGELSEAARVELGNFRTWAETAGISLPTEFPHLPASKPSNENPVDREIRLVGEIEREKKARHRDFMARVAAREGVTYSMLRKIVLRKKARDAKGQI